MARKKRDESEKKKRERIESHGLKKEQKTERGRGGGRGSEEAISTREEGRVNLGYWNPRRGRREECKDKGGYPDKARENHGKVRDYRCKEMIRMQGLPSMTRTK